MEVNSSFFPVMLTSDRPHKFTERPRPGVQTVCSSFSPGEKDRALPHLFTRVCLRKAFSASVCFSFLQVACSLQREAQMMSSGYTTWAVAVRKN